MYIPLARFVIGNSETLDVPGIRDKVIEYYQNRYSANLVSETHAKHASACATWLKQQCCLRKA